MKLRCAPELADEARQIAKARGLTLADVFAAGVSHLRGEA